MTTVELSAVEVANLPTEGTFWIVREGERDVKAEAMNHALAVELFARPDLRWPESSPPAVFTQACAPCETCGSQCADGAFERKQFGCPDCRIELVGPCPTCEARAAALHNAYEVAAERHGWVTQERSRRPWSDVPEANRLTMIDSLRVTLGCDSPTPCEYGTVHVGWAYAVGRPCLIDMVLTMRRVAIGDIDDATEVVIALDGLVYAGPPESLVGRYALELRRA